MWGGKMPEIVHDTISNIDELLEHIDMAFLRIIKYAEKHRLPLGSPMEFHVKRIESLLHEINPSSETL
jgi:hypothetical protein